MNGNGDAGKPLVFISHRHEDGAFASAVRESLLDMSNHAVECFQSGGDWAGQLPPGGVIHQELADRLNRAELLLLVYTHADQDWSYPMWEAGVAFDPRDQSRTRIVVLQFGRDRPAPLSQLKSYDVTDPVAVTDFVRSFLSGEQMFRSRDQPLTQIHENDPVIERHAQEFHTRLQSVPRQQRFFICHSRTDTRAAEVLDGFLRRFGDVDVVTSDDIDSRVGDVDSMLRQRLSSFDHVLWLEAPDDEDLQARMWQAGLVMAWSDPATTRLAVLQAKSHRQAPLAAGRSVTLVDASDLRSLFKDFVDDPSFAVGEDAQDSDTLDEWCTALHRDVTEAMRRARPPVVFICHTREDRDVAKRLADLVESTGVVAAFRSSQQEGFIHAFSEDSIRSLRSCDHVWLLDVDERSAMSYTAWQGGLALGNLHPRRPRVTYLHRREHVPAWLAGRATFDLTQESEVEEFARRLAEEQEFFPSLGSNLVSLVPAWDAEHVLAQLREHLGDALRPRPVEEASWPAHPMMTLAVDLDVASQVRELRREERMDEADKKIVENCTVVSIDRSAAVLLDDLHIREGTPLKPLLAKADTGSLGEWELAEGSHRSLVQQVRDAACGRVPTPDWTRLDDGENTSRHVPVVVQVTRAPTRNRIEVQLIFIRYETEEGEVRLAPSPPTPAQALVGGENGGQPFE